MYEGVSKSFRTESITKYMLTYGITHWEATQRVMAAKLTRLTHKIAIQLHLVAESRTICSSRSRRLVRILLDTPSCIVHTRTQNSESQLSGLVFELYSRRNPVWTGYTAILTVFLWFSAIFEGESWDSNLKTRNLLTSSATVSFSRTVFFVVTYVLR
jgi:hypothetical protein